MALALAPDDSLYLVQIYQELAFCYGALHQVKQAVKMLDKTETLSCDHVDMLVVKGHILLQNQLITKARKYSRRPFIKAIMIPT